MKMTGNNKIKETVEIEYIFPGYHMVLYIIASENHIYLFACLYTKLYLHKPWIIKATKYCSIQSFGNCYFLIMVKLEKKCARLENIENIICYLAYPCVQIVNKVFFFFFF